MTKLSPEQTETLAGASNYRDFIKVVLHSSGRPNFAEVARRANFSSRAFISEVVNGGRRITAKTLPHFIVGLGLRGTHAQLFRLLVLREELDISREPMDLEKKLAEVRAKLKQSVQPQTATPALFQSQHIFSVYAALGSPEAGASLEDIQNRTRLPLDRVQALLEHMSSEKIVETSHGRYFAYKLNLDFTRLGENVSFRAAFVESSRDLARRAAKMGSIQDELFLHAAFSIPRHRVPELNERLRELVLEYIDSAQAEDGDVVVQKLTLGVYQ